MTTTFESAQNLDIHFRKDQDQVLADGTLTVASGEIEHSKYPEWLPTWDPKQKFPQYTPFEHVDRGHFADKDLKNLFPEGGDHTRQDLTPKLGSEVRGIQLSQLTDKQKDDLALYVAQRGVVVFRDQDLKDKGLEFNKKFGEYFGPLHQHPSSGAPLNHPEFHITYRRESSNEYATNFASRTTSVNWHSDVTYEEQPPCITFFTMLEGPSTGGDTVFCDTEEAYSRLSPAFQSMLEGLTANHSSFEQARQGKASGGIERREPSQHDHPIVRTHPVTGKKSLFISTAFITKINGLKVEESQALVSFLSAHAINSVDMQVRATWQPGTVVVWDNRRLLHTAVLDWDASSVRHAYRITPRGERPF
ncbi:hypothetical protein BABINDRAFT_163223 [Babjeviella inositovora NRRL Y-12698]|uniref:TauD/TfdA-like domain-containing protein n=1 Tax=Babjeviella inositovora NRRL Y-12698 TaxID=984486 RepID=A0A1E3QJF1_9ASCO|nr:uncharacterized protein BABINDRAFT_163223 [Babjeviella inositovora NRRL Y-12698]ODQ77836.1 hypothetical protein BABINDRAFT_163223 [Babjeviella inositovora NRRL Y-12698]